VVDSRKGHYILRVGKKKNLPDLMVSKQFLPVFLLSVDLREGKVLGSEEGKASGN
jgi:hypothetical protein